ncbi:HNH endonuclease [Schumannella luteola]|nr:HNH endonuclease [Schumannella luteola]
MPILDAATSPRRGGPRFVDPTAAQRAEGLMRDERTTDQLTLDVFVELIRNGSRVDDGVLLGDRKPVVRVLVTKNDLENPIRDADGNRIGAAFFEGQTDAVSIGTAERFICAGGAIPIQFDADGRVLNLGREQRLFSEKQRVAMAARDGGCLMCGAPPSWCEAHHIDHWDEHAGLTDIDDGVLVCRFCHLNLHNQKWRIRRDGAEYYLERPDAFGLLRRIPLPSRSPAVERLRQSA